MKLLIRKIIQNMLSPTVMLYGLYNKNFLEDEDSIDCLKVISYYFQRNKYERCLEYLKILDERNDPDGVLLLGNYYYYTKDYTKMFNYYIKAVKLNNWYGYYNLGFYYEETQNFQDMKKYYELAIEKDIKEAICNYASYWNDKQDVNRTLKYLKLGIEKQCPKCMNNYAIYNFVIGKNDIAFNLWSKACLSQNKQIILNFIIFMVKRNISFPEIVKKFSLDVEVRDFFNKMLKEKFDEKFAVKNIIFLDEENLKRIKSLPREELF